MRSPAFAISLLVLPCLALAQEIPLTNWTIPPYRTQGGLTTMTDLTPGVGFAGVAPCRLVDTREVGYPAGYGAPALTPGVLRSFDLNSDPLCSGIPAGVDAYSLNVTVTGAAGPGHLVIYPQGGSQPLVSSINYVAGQTIANAVIVPAGTGGGVTVVAGVSATHLIIDINGYWTDQYNAGVSFRAVSNNVAPAILGENTSTVANAVAIQGVITSASAGDFATAVRAINNGDGYGVWGTSATGFGVVAGGGQGAVWAQTNGTIAGIAGVYGSTTSTSSHNYGVFGQTASDQGNSAGVLGRVGAGIGADFFSAGVRGEAFGTGVVGLARTRGVAGAMTDQTGTLIAQGNLGYNSSLSYGVYSFGPYGGTGAKYFVEPHPTDPTQVIRYVSLEGPEAGTYFRGRGRFQNGIAVIDVPESFRLVTDAEGLSVVATAIGPMATISVASVGLDQIVLRGSRNVEFFYVVNGVRKTHKHLTPIGPGREYIPEAVDAKIPLWLTEGQKRMLVSNGTYKPDGTVNLETARRFGWDKEWEKRNQPVAYPASPE